MKLNLGCSDNLLEGWTNVDIVEPADELVDLRKRWPWETGSVDAIRADDIIEHLPNPVHTMNEAWRVLRDHGRFKIFVPTTDGRGAFQDPTHVSYWNRNSFFYFTDGDPHRERFGKAYKIKARFRVIEESLESYPDEVVKLRIVLRAVK